MRVLTIHQPWAALIVRGVKDVENRTWPTTYRGPVLIHAGRPGRRSAAVGPVPDHVSQLVQDWSMPGGGIVGVAELVDCVREHPSPWFTGPIGFVMRNARELPFTACRGQLWLFEPPAELDALVKQLRARSI
jgi:hypothetical protein